MQIRILHRTHYRYGESARGIIQILRLMPRGHTGQHVLDWRVEVDIDARLRESEDSLGNIVHTLDADGQIDELTVTAEGLVETQDFSGVVRGTRERFPHIFFLRDTPTTVINRDMQAYAADVLAAQAQGDRLAQLHALMAALNRDMTFDTDPTHVATTAQEAFSLKRGVCQDLTHMFCGMARHWGIPARYVSGYFKRGDDVTQQDAGHAWAEAYVPELGWLAFDPANGICATDQHVRVAIGLDYYGASPVRGSRIGGRGEAMTVSLSVAQWREPPARTYGQMQQGASSQ